MIPFPFNENRFSFLLASCVQIPRAIGAFYHVLKYTMFNERDRRCAAVQPKRCGRSKEVNIPELIDQRVRVKVTMLRF